MSFETLPLRNQYGSKRRASLLKSSTDDQYASYLEIEVDLDRYLKRVLTYKEWDKNWDVGLFKKDDTLYLMLSKRNKDLDTFAPLEKVEYSRDLRVSEWLSGCLRKHKQI